MKNLHRVPLRSRPLNPLKGTYSPLGDRALKNCPVGNFSEGQPQGRPVVGVGGDFTVYLRTTV